MENKISIGEIKFSDNNTINFEHDQITVFVGPNNAGKSATLKEISTLTQASNRGSNVILDFKLRKEGSIESLKETITSNSIKEINPNQNTRYTGYKFSIYEGHIDHIWNASKDLGDLHAMFVNLISTEERLTIANPATNISLINEAFTHPIHFIQKDDNLEIRFSRYFQQAFGKELIVHRNAGRIVPLYIGQRPEPNEGDDRVSINYLRELEKLPLLHEQGDGMRSFVGVLLSTIVSDQSLLLLDEPEAFLHPPQARFLGKMLSKDLPSTKQMFLATHSSDFLKGMLETNDPRLKIIRIQRNGDVNEVSVLNNDDIKELWSDTLLRHSNILDGLFHDKVIICESDSDCRFYNALLQAIFESKESVIPDLLFVHCGGKHRVNVVIKSLKKLNVDICAVLDFDVLNNINPIKSIYEDFGGIWADIKDDWKLVKESIDVKRPELETKDVKDELDDILENITDRIFPTDQIANIKRILKRASAWAHAKEVGKAFVPSGNPRNAYDRLIKKLRDVGFFIVEVGELESFDKSIGNHGPKWVNSVLSKDLAEDPSLEEARKFVEQLIE